MKEILFTVSFCTFFEEKSAFVFDVEQYDTNALFCLKEGSFTYGYSKEAADRYAAQAGDVILCEKGQQFFRKVLEPVSLCMIKFEAQQPLQGNGHPIKVSDFARLKYNLTMLESSHFMIDPMPGSVTEHYCRDIIYQTIDALCADTKPLNQAYMYMNSHFTEEVSISELAQQVNFSVVHFINLFKKEYQLTPKQYMIQLRMKKAFHLLEHTSFSVSEIAAMCGYEDVLYFSRHFKGFTGVSPRMFRKNCKS